MQARLFLPLAPAGIAPDFFFLLIPHRLIYSVTYTASVLILFIFSQI